MPTGPIAPLLKPDWLRVKAPQRERIGEVADLLLDLKLNTVCQEASCPNIGECFAGGTATFLIMGPGCTRACPYCDIDFDKSVRTLDPSEPQRLGEAVARLGLKHVVITSVNRDDLADGGASQFVACIEQVRQRSPLTTIELLIPDFCGNWDALAAVMAAAPDVLNHNIETVPRLYKKARPQGIYERSLELLQRVRDGWPRAYTKSGQAPAGGSLRDPRAVRRLPAAWRTGAGLPAGGEHSAHPQQLPRRRGAAADAAAPPLAAQLRAPAETPPPGPGHRR